MPEAFQFNSWAILPATGAVYMAFWGTWAFLKNPRQSVRQAFFFFAISSSVTYFLQALIYSTSLKAPIPPYQQIIMIFILASGLTMAIFIRQLLQIRGWKKVYTAFYIITGAFVLMNLGPWAIDLKHLHPLPWNMAPSLSTLGKIMMYFFQAEVVFALYIAWKTYHDTSVHPNVRSRGKIAFWSTLVCSLAILDFWHYYGVPFPPIGAVSVSIWITFFMYAMQRYQVLEITPEVAAAALIEAIPGALFIADEHGKIVISNSVTRELTGLTSEALLGLSVGELLPGAGKYFSDKNEKLKKLVVGIELELVGKKERLPVSVSVSPLSKDLGFASGLVFVAVDIKSTKDHLTLIEHQKAELQKTLAEMKEIQEKLVGREMRMIELKKEIETLKGKKS